ncbi:MAG: UDP-N-acetylmuramoyl-tripeptide--D-alanyl-D-alanine ligase [Chitinophagales bacterium]|nr:UDP-N-acetylmuramoyl-tripeptide--D-alanyl-D-alanine ligase [Chitinophagales bacterium]
MEIKQLHSLFLNSKGVCTDTRTLQKDEIFFALKGGNFNGNIYAKQALENGAKYVVIDEKEYEQENTILVKDVLATLQELAAYHRAYLNIPIIGITGSNGKTTTKELLSVVLNKRYKTFATKGNLNNHIGVPLSLLSISNKHEMAIIEMGANHVGEIETYCWWAMPNYGIITNIGKAHLEGFGGVEGVIKGKTELYKAVNKNNGLVFYNADDAVLTEQSKKCNNNYSYAQNSQADFNFKINSSGAFVKVSVGNTIINSHLIGNYNGVNIGTALAIGSYFKISLNEMKEAIENYVPQNNRSEVIKFKDNTIVLDAYNANPSSMKVALESFNNIDNLHKIVILGDMFEVGKTSSNEHKNLIDYALAFNFEQCVFVGKAFYEHKNKLALFFETTQKAKKWFQAQNFSKKYILIKGSRGMALEQLV